MTTKAPQAPQPAADAPGTAVGQAGPRRAGEYPENTAAAGGGRVRKGERENMAVTCLGNCMVAKY